MRKARNSGTRRDGFLARLQNAHALPGAGGPGGGDCPAVPGAHHDHRVVVGSDAADVRWVDPAEFAALERAGALVDRLAETLWGWGVLDRPH